MPISKILTNDSNIKIKEGVIYYKLKTPFAEMEDFANSGENSSEPSSSNGFGENSGNFEDVKNSSIRTAKKSSKNKGLRPKITSLFKLAASHGFEPRLTESESAVLPLDDEAT